MKKILLSSILLMAYMCAAQSPQNQIDSLKNVIDNYGEPDEHYIKLRSSYVGKKMFLTPTDSTWLDYNLKTLEIAKKINYEEGQVLAYGNIGIVHHYFLSDPYKAIDCYLNAMDLIKKHDRLDVYSTNILHNIGLIYYEQEEYKKALTYLKGALKQINNSKNNPDVNAKIASKYYASVLVNLGNVYQGLNQPDSSIYFFKKGIRESKKINHHLSHANALSNLTRPLFKIGKLKEALASIEESLNLVNTYKLELIRVPVYLNAAKTYADNSDYKKAEDYALKTLNLNKSLNNLNIQSSVWENLANIYQRKKEYKKAFDAFTKHVVLKDSLTSNDRKLEISRKEIQFEADKKQLLAQEEINRQKLITNTSIYAGSGIVLTSIIGFVLYRRKQDAVAKAKEAEFKTKVADTELKVLRTQMNPHFIFNSLNSIGNYILNNNTDAANNYLTKFSKLMRQTLESSEKEEILLQKDIELLKTYLDIEKKRFAQGFNYDIKMDNDIDIENTLIPPMMLQPFVENSIWHGISKMAGRGTISIEIKKHKNMIVYAVDDNGVGRQQTNKLNHSKKDSLGIKITKNRIDIINKRKKTNASLKIIDKEKGTRVEVTLPLQLAFV